MNLSNQPFRIHGFVIDNKSFQGLKGLWANLGRRAMTLNRIQWVMNELLTKAASMKAN